MKQSRISREQESIAKMIGMYCQDKHGSGGTLCPECRQLADYARQRLERCPFGSEKPVCAKCPIHCYQPVMRSRVIAVMRYAGPRMLGRFPVLAIRHIIDSLRRPARRPRHQ